MKVNTQIIIGDCRKVLKTLKRHSVDCIVTSPPYFALRDYGAEDQIGLEDSAKSYIEALSSVFLECQRVLKKTGTLWVNIGDRYSSSAAKSSIHNINSKKNTDAIGGFKRPKSGENNKQRLMIPARLALRLKKDGWCLRDEIIWHKTMVMPVPLKDRTTPAHEMVYMFSLSKSYYYNIEATKEIALQINTSREKQSNLFKSQLSINRDKIKSLEKRSLRSVWSIAPFSNPENEHYAAYPPALVEPCVLAGSPIGGMVLDPFGGIGTTALVANDLRRNAILIEIVKTNAKVAQRRINSLRGFFVGKAEIKNASV